MVTIQNTNERYGDPVEFTGSTIEEAVQNMQETIRACGPEFEGIVVTANDYIEVEGLYLIYSIKYREEFEGSEAEAIERARDINREYQPAFGVQIYRVDEEDGLPLFDTEDDDADADYYVDGIAVDKSLARELGDNGEAGDECLTLYVAPRADDEDGQIAYLTTAGDPLLVAVIWPDGEVDWCGVAAPEWVCDCIAKAAN